MPPNEVSYLKGSSMDCFTLGLPPKINFNYEQEQHNNNDLRTIGSSQFLPKIYSLSYKEFNTEFYKEYMPRGLYL
jgi:hypothetical protein